VRYDRGPTKRIEVPRAVSPSAESPRSAAPKSPKSPDSKAPRAAVEPTGNAKSPVKSWKDLRSSKPDSARDVVTRTRVAGKMQDTALGVAVGAAGGVYPGPYRGGSNGWDCNDDWVCDPWGFDDWSCSISFGCGWWWSWPLYWSCYYPAWWWWSYPYYYSSYCYYPAATTVVYQTEPQIVYLPQEGYASQEAVGEAALRGEPAPSGPVGSPLSIAAQRYLELGDRAFREGRYTDAVQFYAKAVEFAPDQGALYLVLADALFAAGDYHYGAYAIRRALELDPSLVDSTVDKHSFYPDPAIFDQQLDLLERYLADHPSDRDARLVLALNYLFASRPKDAVRTLESAGASLAEDAAAQKILGRSRASARD